MKKIILLVWIIGIATISFSQTITIKDNKTNLPLEMVSIVSNTPRVATFTNHKGQADISDFEGAELIEIRLIGYKPIQKSYAELKTVSYAISMEDAGLSLDEVVVSATRWNQNKNEVPAKITSISAKDVALQNPQTAADLLGSSGEVFIQKSQGGGGSPMIRGFSTNRLLITVDGVRMNTAIFRSGNLQNVISIDPFAIENTEVLFGPGSVIYGSDAIGGVMNFQTISPQFSTTDEPLVTGSAATRYSSANSEQTGHFDVNVGWKKWAMTSSITHSDFGNLRMGTKGPNEYLRNFFVERIDSVDVVKENSDPLVQNSTGYEQTSFMQKIRYKPNKNWDFNYGFMYSTTSEYDRYDRLTRIRNGLPRSAEWKYGPQEWAMNHLSITNNANSGIYDHVTLHLAHQYFEESRIDRDFNKTTQRTRLEEVNAFSANLDFEKNLGSTSKIFYGGEMVYNDVNSFGTDKNIKTNVVKEAASRYPQSSWESYAAYVTFQTQLTDKLLLQAGGRYNLFKLDAEFDTSLFFLPFTTANIDNDAITGSLGFVFQPTEKWNISVNGSTGFRSPNVDDVGKIFDSEAGSVVTPNPDLDAEYAYNAELSISKVFGDIVKITATGYYTRLEDALVRRDFQFNGQDSIMFQGDLSQVQAIQNAAFVEIVGFHAGIEIKLPAGFGLISRFNFQDGTEELDDKTESPSRHAAPAFGTSHLTFKTKQLALDFYAQYSAGVDFEDLAEEEKGKPELYAIDENGNPYSPSWLTLNFKANYQLNENFSISGGIENLTDERYRTYSSGITAPGRNFILSLRAKF
ncbi:MAG: TonB-dependent receptor [Bacteroidetes bacterium HGW-Bacteroidetes-12]|nr:MAG: TonB-dependent receptor [Bacteroidetes bacterium HGW-Bacteroidetes-12]